MRQLLRRTPITLALVIALLTAGCSATVGSTTRVVGNEPEVMAFDGHTTVVTPGGVATNSVTVGDTTLEYRLFAPSSFTQGASAPLLIALPPGPQTASSVDEMLAAVFIGQAEQRGWVVVSPIAPGGVKFFEGSEDLIPAMISVLQDEVMTIEGGKPHLAGVSNGGISSFRLAALQPNGYASMTVFPGFPRSDDDLEALPILTDMPIAMFVGGNDTPWLEASQDTLMRLQEFGGDVSFEVVPGEDHVIQSLWRDSTPIWDALSSARLSAS